MASLDSCTRAARVAALTQIHVIFEPFPEFFRLGVGVFFLSLSEEFPSLFE
ncbi:MAG: hypothetical protein GF334_10235 [Candidatus Altiarchaeales archaeon]|nr:hypothetical protein [Candidatus Altiarchaeales archaeon]